MASRHVLPFEKDIYEMEDLLAKLEAQSEGGGSASDEVRRIADARRSRPPPPDNHQQNLLDL